MRHLFLILALLLSATLAACQPNVSASTSTPAPGGTELTAAPPVSEPSLPADDVQKIFDRACAALVAQPNVRWQFAGFNPDPVEGLIEVMGQDRAHFAPQSQDIQEAIIIAPALYLYRDGAWEKQAASGTDVQQWIQTDLQDARKLIELFVCPARQDTASAVLDFRIKNLELQASEAQELRGMPVRHHTLSAKLIRDEGEVPCTLEYWLEEASGLPYLFESRCQTSHGETRMSADYSYDDFKIQAPIP